MNNSDIILSDLTFAKVSTPNSDVEKFLLTKNGNVGYIDVLPTTLCYTVFVPYITANIHGGATNGILQIDSKRDVLTAEIKYLDKKLITTIKIKEN